MENHPNTQRRLDEKTRTDALVSTGLWTRVGAVAAVIAAACSVILLAGCSTYHPSLIETNPSSYRQVNHHSDVYHWKIDTLYNDSQIPGLIAYLQHTRFLRGDCVDHYDYAQSLPRSDAFVKFPAHRAEGQFAKSHG